MKTNFLDIENEIRDIVSKFYPRNEIEEMHPYKNGFKYPVWRVKLKEKYVALVIKVIVDKQLSERRHMESFCYRNLLKVYPDFPVPNIIAFQETNANYKHNFIIEEEIKGIDLCFSYGNIENKRELLEELARIVGSINSIKYSSSGYFDRNFKTVMKDSWENTINTIFYKYISTIEVKLLLDKELIKEIKSYWNRSRKYLDFRGEASLIHNDITDRNIKVIETAKGNFYISGIFDFELCMRGDPLKDLSKIQWILRRFPTEQKYFYCEYDKYIKLTEDYERRIEMYCLIDRLKHMSEKDYLKRFDGWKDFLEEGEEEIKRIVTC